MVESSMQCIFMTGTPLLGAHPDSGRCQRGMMLGYLLLYDRMHKVSSGMTFEDYMTSLKNLFSVMSWQATWQAMLDSM